MQYNGGKQLVARELAQIISSFQPKVYWEPFVGAASVIELVKAPLRIGSDLDVHIISYLDYIGKGWAPPQWVVTRDIYRAWKCYNPSNQYEFALKAMIGFGCSFGGKFFDGFACNRRGDDFWAIARNKSLKRDLKGIEFRHHSFLQFPPESPDLIYCDPPYAGTAKVGSNRQFDSILFWAWCRACALSGIRVLVTEFSAPPFAYEIWRKDKNKGFHRANGSQLLTERLFMVEA